MEYRDMQKAFRHECMATYELNIEQALDLFDFIYDLIHSDDDSLNVHSHPSWNNTNPEGPTGPRDRGVDGSDTPPSSSSNPDSVDSVDVAVDDDAVKESLQVIGERLAASNGKPFERMPILDRDLNTNINAKIEKMQKGSMLNPETGEMESGVVMSIYDTPTGKLDSVVTIGDNEDDGIL